MASDNEWPSAVGNLRKARKKWARMSRILEREGENERMSGTLFKAMVQAVLLSGSETWVLTPCMGRTLGGFHHRVACRMTEKNRGAYLPAYGSNSPWGKQCMRRGCRKWMSI